jgi:hypothetical protein
VKEPPALVDAAKLPPVTIVDMYLTKPNETQTFYYVVVSRKINLVYSRVAPTTYVGKDGDFYDFLYGDSRPGQAFGGRKFKITMDDGSQFECNGNMWSGGRPAGYDTVEIGAASQEELNYCYVFCGASVERRVLEEWLATHEPKTDYTAFDPKEPARKAFQAEQARLAEEKRAKQAACTHDYEEIEEEQELCNGDDCWEVDVVFDRCKLCGHETEPREL